MRSSFLLLSDVLPDFHTFGILLFREQGRLFEKDGIPHLACGEGSVALLVVQPEGKKPMDGAAWLKGIRLENGEMIDRP